MATAPMTTATSRWTVRPLSLDRLPDFLRFFGGDAFADNPKWWSCYCQCFYEDHTKVVWKDRTAAQNRTLACTRAGDRTMQGYLAYDHDEVVGWCNAAPRNLVPALDDEPVPDADVVAAVTCFVVRPQFRMQGVARTLLAAACEGLRAQGLQVVEAYPRPDAPSAAEHHFGPLSLYLSSGFVASTGPNPMAAWWSASRCEPRARIVAGPEPFVRTAIVVPPSSNHESP